MKIYIFQGLLFVTGCVFYNSFECGSSVQNFELKQSISCKFPFFSLLLAFTFLFYFKVRFL